MTEQKILEILKDNTLTTGVVRNKLHYDHNIDKPTYQIRATLNKMKVLGMVILDINTIRGQLVWSLSKTKGKTLYT